MKKIRLLILFFSFTSFTDIAFGQCVQGQTFTCFDQQDADKIFKDLTSAFAPTTVSGANSLGNVFGVELGLVLTASQAPNTQEVVESYNSDFEVPFIPMAGISGIVSLPFGLGIEGTFIPKVNIEDEGSFQSFNIGARWTITDIFPMDRLKVILRTSYMTADATYTYEEDTGNLIAGTVTESADFDVEIFEVGVAVGFAFKFFEPYFGASDLQSSGDVYATGSSTGSLIISDINQSSKTAGLRVYTGVLFKLPALRLGAEIATFDGIERASIKIAFKL